MRLLSLKLSSLFLLNYSTTSAFILGSNEYSETNLYEMIEETVYRQLRIPYESEAVTKAKGRLLKNSRSAPNKLEFDESECDESFPYLDYFPWNNKNFLKPLFQYNWNHTMGEAASPERRQKTCKFLRGGLTFLNAGWNAQENEVNGKILTPKTNLFLHWLKVADPLVTGTPFYDYCMTIRSQAKSDPPIGVFDALGKTLKDENLKQHIFETTNYVSSLLVSPFLEVYLGGVLLQAGIGRALNVAFTKPVIDLKQCAKVAGYAGYAEVGIEIDELVVNLNTYFNAVYGFLSPETGARDFNWMPVTEPTNSNVSMENLDKSKAWNSPEMLSSPGMYYLYLTNEWVHYDNITEDYLTVNTVQNEITRWGLNSDKDYIDVQSGDFKMYSYYLFKKREWVYSDYYNDMYGWLFFSSALMQTWHIAVQTGGPVDTSTPHFGDRALIEPSGKIHGGSSPWRPTFPSQMPHAYYSQQIAYNDTSMSEQQQLDVINSMEFMSSEVCKDEGNELYEAPVNLTSMMDFYPFLCKQMKWYGFSSIIRADPKIKKMGCRYKLMEAQLKTIEFHEKLGYTPETAKLRSILFGMNMYNFQIVINLTNTIFLITASNIFFFALIFILLVWIFIKTFFKLIHYCGFDLVKLGKYIDDRKYYETNQAKASMKKFWKNTEVGQTDHKNYPWDFPAFLMRPEGGNYIQDCEIFNRNAKQMRMSVETSSERTAPPYMLMNRSRGSSEDIQSVAIFGIILAIFWYAIFNSGNFKQ